MDNKTKNLCLNCKGHGTGRALGRQAADLLLSTQHLLAMSSLPALCNICCICLEYLLLEERDDERGSMTREKAREKGVQMPGGGRGGGGDKVMDVTNGEAQLPFTPAQIFSTHTQVYLTVLGAFLSCDPEKRGRNDTPKNMTTQQRWRLSTRTTSQHWHNIKNIHLFE